MALPVHPGCPSIPAEATHGPFRSGERWWVITPRGPAWKWPGKTRWYRQRWGKEPKEHLVLALMALQNVAQG